MQRLQSLGQRLGLEEHLHIVVSTCVAPAGQLCFLDETIQQP